ncbi:MAG: bile acid:sodium symporter [Dermatophilaceae bacterium]
MTADQLLTALFNAGIAISVGATVLSLGMTFTLGQLVAPLRRVGLVIAMVVLNAAVIPAVAWGIAKASPMDSASVPGLVLATLGAGSAGSLKAAQLAKRADLALAVSVAVLLQLVNIVAVPLWAGKVVTGASISAWDIVKSLLALVLLPLVVGLFVRARYADHAQAWEPGLVKAANLALVIAMATGIAANWSTIASMFGSWVIVTAIVIIIVAGVLGLLLGGRSVETRTTTGLVSTFRFGSLGLIIIGTQLDGNPTYLGPAIVFALVDFILPLAVAVEIGHRTSSSATTSRPSQKAPRP